MKSVSIIDRKKCFSCCSCVQICPKNAIDMQENNEGFFYPSINESKCVECGLCLKHCPSFAPYEKNDFKKTSYAVWLKDDKKLFESSSGALFSAAAEKILKNGGVVFGAAYNADLFVEHICIEDINELYKLKGSKYVESTTNSTYSKVLPYLKNGKKVLYSGTPCQIAGLKKFLGKDYENLFTMDLICHGVPSERLFHKYLEWQSGQLGGKIIYCGFRDKDVGGCSCFDNLANIIDDFVHENKNYLLWSILILETFARKNDKSILYEKIYEQKRKSKDLSKQLDFNFLLGFIFFIHLVVCKAPISGYISNFISNIKADNPNCYWIFMILSVFIISIIIICFLHSFLSSSEYYVEHIESPEYEKYLKMIAKKSEKENVTMSQKIQDCDTI